MDTIEPTTSPLARLSGLGTSVWLDFVSRSLLKKQELDRLIETDDVRGVTSNPSIFEKAIGHSDEYDEDLTSYEQAHDHSVSALFEHLAVDDIRAAADVLRPIYDRTQAVDGYVSLEVSPYLALETEKTLTEARHLWHAVGRPNLMVKVPGTTAGAPAVEALIADGININVTLLFSIESYRAVADAYMKGLETRVARGQDIAQIGSVASFFVSRIDSAVEERSKQKLASATPEQATRLHALRGKVAIANAKMAYQLYKELIASARWKALAEHGAHPQRLLWASTGTKLSGLPDTLYVDALIGPDTVNTMPPATMDAVRDHGTARATIEQDLEAARETLRLLDECGLSLDEITADLVTDGVKQFADAADKLYGAVALKRATVLGGKEKLQTIALKDKDLSDAVAGAMEHWRADGLLRRMWAGDAGVWTGKDENRWLGWLTLVEAGQAALPSLEAFQRKVAQANYADVLLLGMGGSSLGPEVLAETFGRRAGYPRLHIVDSTDPTQLRAARAAIDPARTLFLVSSKSGSTLEPNIFKDYFLDEARHAGADGGSFVAITDPGSALEKAARGDGFGEIFHGDPAVGGRFSVLSMFGLVPAAAIGVDLASFLSLTQEMVRGCGPDVPPAVNPGVELGVALGVLATRGRDKVTFVASPGIGDIGAWLEQLLAESTGKQGRGIVPIASEPLAAPSAYGNDRVFVYLELADAPDTAQRGAIEALAQAGQPVIRITVPTKLHLGQEFFRFEVAVAVAGAIIGINPFDQPDVEASKVATRKLTDEFEQSGQLQQQTPVFHDQNVGIYADQANAAALGDHDSVRGYLRAQFARLRPGDYVALLAYIPRDAETIDALRQARTAIRDATRAATAAEFGPRFLHSTGQAYKGGPNSGVFLQITCDDPVDLPVPGRRYTFGTVKQAQAMGDMQVLVERGRRALRVHLHGDLGDGLRRLVDDIKSALH